jgi:uncharacterized protein YciI
MRAMPGFVFKLIPPRDDFATDMSVAERATMNEHVEYWRALMAAGHVVAFGPVADAAGPYGIGIIVADALPAAEALCAGDPAVQSSHGFRADIAPMLRLVTPGGIH